MSQPSSPSSVQTRPRLPTSTPLPPPIPPLTLSATATQHKQSQPYTTTNTDDHHPTQERGEAEGEASHLVAMQAPGPSQRSLRRSPGAEPGPPPNVPVRSISPAVGLTGAIQPRASTASSRSNHSNERNSGNPKRPSVSCFLSSLCNPYPPPLLSSARV